MTVKEILKDIISTPDELAFAIKNYEENGYVTTRNKEINNDVTNALEANDFYIYDTQFIDGEYRIYIEL